ATNSSPARPRYSFWISNSFGELLRISLSRSMYRVDCRGGTIGSGSLGSDVGAGPTWSSAMAAPEPGIAAPPPNHVNTQSGQLHVVPAGRRRRQGKSPTDRSARSASGTAAVLGLHGQLLLTGSEVKRIPRADHEPVETQASGQHIRCPGVVEDGCCVQPII